MRKCSFDDEQFDEINSARSACARWTDGREIYEIRGGNDARDIQMVRSWMGGMGSK